MSWKPGEKPQQPAPKTGAPARRVDEKARLSRGELGWTVIGEEAFPYMMTDKGPILLGQGYSEAEIKELVHRYGPSTSTGTLAIELAKAGFILDAANAYLPNASVLTAGTGITVTISGGLATIATTVTAFDVDTILTSDDGAVLVSDAGNVLVEG